MSCKAVIEQIRKLVEAQPDASYKIVIGTDSHTTKNVTTMVTALIVHRVGRGAVFYFRKMRSRAMPDLRKRIYRETELSLELVDALMKVGLDELCTVWPLEIHVDIGQRGETKALIQEITGWITSVGYTVRIKPDSFGASSVADRFTS
jgi:hypothetical protein